ncbi:zinc finger matrin-type protein 5-like, partial [Mytilus californianus]|uniref:zinc finger matrin-type protein 5-like n=1 Tax=Mytilus californianus TaxID=6549 RepID=UPI0022463B23
APLPRRYYCDFCDKSFADNPVARKNHMNGTTHQRNRKQHYDSFRDPEILLFEEINKKPCKHFLQSGTCTFFDSCRFSHLREDEKEQLRTQATEMKTKKYKRQDIKKDENDEDLKTFFTEEHCLLQTVANLPPSLVPPPPDSFLDLELKEWG